MIRKPSTIFLRKDASSIFTVFFGGLRLITILGIVFLIITLDWFSGTINDLIGKGGSTTSSGSTSIQVWDWVKLLLFPMYLVGCWYYARKHSQRVKTNVKEKTDPGRVNALILFLSPPGTQDTTLIESLIQEGGRIADKSLLNQFKGSWRMPLEAIAHHLYRLEKVIVITTEGTHKYFETFKTLVLALTTDKPTDHPRLDIQSPQDFDISMDHPLSSESFKELNDAVNAIYNQLQERHNIRHSEIIIDITGGKKTCSVAGAVVSLAKGKRFQYVSTDNYDVREYDVTLVGESD